jgi:hypothetical protein
MTLTVTPLHSPVSLAEYEGPAHWPLLTPQQIVQHAPDLSLVCTSGGAIVARCSLWWSNTPSLNTQKVGTIGHYAATHVDAAQTLLHAACDVLRSNKCDVAVGPMDGNTWRSYRFVTDTGAEAPFFMEPTNPPDYPEHMVASGFAPLAHYSSALNTDLTIRDKRVDDLVGRFKTRDVTLRALRVDRFEDELHGIFRVSEAAFAKNFLYTPIAEAQFTAQYLASKPIVVPELVIIAEHEDATVGYCVSIPDMNEKSRGRQPTTVILKTVAILPERARFSGLGALMIDRTHAVAHRLGFTRVIHALMHDTNQSKAISSRTSAVMRRYALYGRTLA